MSNELTTALTKKELASAIKMYKAPLAKTSKPKIRKKPVVKVKEKKKNEVKTVTLVKEVAPPTVISEVEALKLAQGVVTNININTPINQTAFQFIPVGIVTLAMNRGYNVPYLFYLGIYDDIYSIATGGPGTAVNRLGYQNDIYIALAPKTIPFRQTGAIGFKFTQFASSPPGSFLTLDGGLFYYMYESAGAMLGVWALQDPPSYAINPETIADGYATALQLLTGKAKHLQLVRGVDMSKRYARDASAYARNSVYYGQGAGSTGGPNVSLELEVPFSSRMLGTLQNFDPLAARSSRVLTYASGDSISNWSIGALPTFFTSYYNGAITPFYKFLDLTELVHALLTAYIQAIELYIASTPNLTTELAALLTGGFGCTYTQFFIMVRQQVAYMFNDSQAIGQGITPSTSVNGFRPFIMGSNAYGRKPQELIQIPTVLNENLRCLKMAIRPYSTKQYANSNNHITHVPVWGTFGGYVPLVYSFNIDGTPINLFIAENLDPNTPSVFDGTSGGDVVDFNDTPLIATICELWNENMRVLTNMFSSLTVMGGDATAGPFLQFTRYCAFNSINLDITNRRRVPRFWDPYIKEIEEEKEVVGTVSGLTKKVSKTAIKSKKRIYAPPNSSILSQYTIAYSGMIPISPTHKENFCNIILPVVEVSPAGNSLPNMTQIQTATQEPYLLNLIGVSNIQSNRGDEIQNAIINYVVGAAGKKSELSEFVSGMSKENEGGFFGDLFAAIAPTAVGGLGTLIKSSGI